MRFGEPFATLIARSIEPWQHRNDKLWTCRLCFGLGATKHTVAHHSGCVVPACIEELFASAELATPGEESLTDVSEEARTRGSSAEEARSVDASGDQLVLSQSPKDSHPPAAPARFTLVEKIKDERLT